MSERRPSQDTALPGALRPGTERSLVLPSATSYALAADNDQTFMLLGEQDAEHDGTPITNDSSGRVSSLDQTGLAGPLQSSQTVHGKVACQVCQRRKVKCSGQVDGQPIQYSLQCDFCTRNGLQCVWKPPKRNMVNANTRRRPNTAVRHGSSQDSAEGSTSVPQNRSACTECRRRKQRCTGDRPSCRFCAEKGVECSYEVADGMTRSEDLKLKVREATERGDRLDQLVDAMRQGSDQQSSELLARLRVGATLDDLLDPETRLDHFPEYIRNGQVDRAAWLESFGGEVRPDSRAVDTIRANQASGMPITAAEGSRDPVSTSTTSPSYSFEFSMPPPRLSPKDIDQANNPFNRSFPPS